MKKVAFLVSLLVLSALLITGCAGVQQGAPATESGAEAEEGAVTLTVFDVVGRPLERKAVNDQEGTIQIGANLPAGYFFATLSLNGEPLKTFRMVKVE